MTQSPQPDAPHPLSDRARDWLFRLYYAHLVNGLSPQEELRNIAAIFVLSDDEWEARQQRSPYVHDARAGHVAQSVWDRVAPDVELALDEMIAHRSDIEDVIQSASRRWRLERMPVVDRALLTIGCFELIQRGARPAKRVINRTVELAKRYGEADSKRFVNGILDQIRKNSGIENRSATNRD